MRGNFGGGRGEVERGSLECRTRAPERGAVRARMCAPVVRWGARRGADRHDHGIRPSGRSGMAKGQFAPPPTPPSRSAMATNS